MRILTGVSMLLFLPCCAIVFADTQDDKQKNRHLLEEKLDRYESLVEQVLRFVAMRNEALQAQKKEEAQISATDVCVD